LKDHLGNLRTACRCGERPTEATPGETYEPLVVQEVHYDPFGLQLKAISGVSTAGPVNRFTYLGREEQGDLGYLDLMARQYDPSNGRFVSVDPLTDQQESLSPYHYGYNNPLRYSDPDGLMANGPSPIPRSIVKAMTAPRPLMYANRASNAGRAIFTAKVGVQAVGIEGGIKIGSAKIVGGVSFYEVEGQLKAESSQLEMNAFKFNAGAGIGKNTVEGELKANIFRLDGTSFKGATGKAEISAKGNVGRTSANNEGAVGVSGKLGPISLGAEAYVSKAFDFIDNSINYVQSVINEVITQATNNTFNTDPAERNRDRYVEDQRKNN